MIKSNESKYFAVVDSREAALTELSQKVWEYAEPGLQEKQSAKAIADYLESEGFRVQRGVGTIPTAICAEYGSGHPVIAYLGEYDALARLDQKVVTHKEAAHPEEPDRYGHGCGHNNLGVGAVGAAVMLKEAIAAGEV